MQGRGDLVACLLFAIAVAAIVGERQVLSGDITGTVALNVHAPYALVGVQSGKCVQVPTSGAVLEIGTCNGSASQRFKVEPRAARSYRLRSMSNGLCADVEGADQSAGASIIQFPCTDGRNQRWTFTRVARRTYEIAAVHSGQVLDVRGASTEDRAPLDQWYANHGDNQRFHLQSD
jgi:polyhydroxybutyrate depolymerase